METKAAIDDLVGRPDVTGEEIIEAFARDLPRILKGVSKASAASLVAVMISAVSATRVGNYKVIHYAEKEIDEENTTGSFHIFGTGIDEGMEMLERAASLLYGEIEKSVTATDKLH